MKDGDEFALTVTVPAEQWAFACRRLLFLEASVVQILSDRGWLREWFTAPELAALRLPGLPTTRQGVARLAKAERWRCRIVLQRGQEVREYHCTALPGRAFDQFIERIITAPRPVSEVVPPHPAIAATPAPPIAVKASNAIQPWVLPLMRIIRTQGVLSVARAMRELSEHLPPGAPRPTVEEAEEVLRGMGMLV